MRQGELHELAARIQRLAEELIGLTNAEFDAVAGTHALRRLDEAIGFREGRIDLDTVDPSLYPYVSASSAQK